MDFAYDGFEHGANKRRFFFRRIPQTAFSSSFLIEVDMALLARNGVAVQEAPLFCLGMLCGALASGESALENYRQYELRHEDFQGLRAERAKQQEELQMRRQKNRLKPPQTNPNLAGPVFAPMRTHSS
jgi:hypothetical protein